MNFAVYVLVQVSMVSHSSSEDGHIIVSPDTSVTLTCMTTGIAALTWLDQNGQINMFLISHYDARPRFSHYDSNKIMKALSLWWMWTLIQWTLIFLNTGNDCLSIYEVFLQRRIWYLKGLFIIAY